MWSEQQLLFTKDNLDALLKELAKEFRKLNGLSVPADSIAFINNALQKGDYENIYAVVIEEEKRARDMLIRFGEDYPGVATESNVNDILASLKSGFFRN